MDEKQIVSPTYRQKSRIFLWPLLQITRQVRFKPIKTYMSDTKLGLTPKDRCLIAPFKKDKSYGFSIFEAEVLLNNEFFKDFYETENELVYIFDLNPYRDDYDKIVRGEYSKLSGISKTLINRFFGVFKMGGLKPHVQVNAYLNPTERIYELVAEQLGVDVNSLGGELLDPPDLIKETFDESKIAEEQRSTNAKVPD